MREIEELQQALDLLNKYVAELTDAQSELSSWQSHDLHRKDGSGAQDARHEKHGRDAQDDVYDAKRKVESQARIVAALAGKR